MISWYVIINDYFQFTFSFFSATIFTIVYQVDLIWISIDIFSELLNHIVITFTLVANQLNHLDHHFRKKESEHEMFDVLEHLTPRCQTLFVQRIEHGQCDAIDDDHKHADSFEPCATTLRKIIQPHNRLLITVIS